MEVDDALLNQDFFQSSFNKQDITTLPSYKRWIEAKKNQGKKVVKCPWCWGYEVFVEPTNHTCPMCQKQYCQHCLLKCVENEVRHDHERTCCSKCRGIIGDIIFWGTDAQNAAQTTTKELILVSLVFVFGNHVLLTKKYFQFFCENYIVDNICVHTFFQYMNLFANILYCIVFNIIYFEFFFFLFFPGIFIKCYLKFIAINWLSCLKFGLDELPITEITVRGKGCDFY